MSSNILILGKNGQLAQSLGCCLKNQNYPFSCYFYGKEDVDVFSDSFYQILKTLKPKAIINCFAYTKVDLAEDFPNEAQILNQDIPEKLAKLTAAMKIPLIHISTDYVFDGEKVGFYNEKDSKNPLSVYGRTKSLGEDAIIQNNPLHVILRTAWVYSPFGHNFMKTMIHLSKSKQQISVVSDQIGTPTSALDLGEVLLTIVDHILNDTATFGVFHYASTNDTNWAEFATCILENYGKLSGQKIATIAPITTKDYPTKAKRPLNSCLDASKIKHLYDIAPKTYEDAVKINIQYYLQEEGSA